MSPTPNPTTTTSEKEPYSQPLLTVHAPLLVITGQSAVLANNNNVNVDTQLG